MYRPALLLLEGGIGSGKTDVRFQVYTVCRVTTYLKRL
jgi:hypothetical protein